VAHFVQVGRTDPSGVVGPAVRTFVPALIANDAAVCRSFANKMQVQPTVCEQKCSIALLVTLGYSRVMVIGMRTEVKKG